VKRSLAHDVSVQAARECSDFLARGVEDCAKHDPKAAVDRAQGVGFAHDFGRCGDATNAASARGRGVRRSNSGWPGSKCSRFGFSFASEELGSTFRQTLFELAGKPFLQF
jgi:hypothetical protein